MTPQERFKQNNRRWALIYKALHLEHMPITVVQITDFNIAVYMKFNRRFNEYAANCGWETHLNSTTGYLTIIATGRKTKDFEIVFYINE